MSKQLTNQSRRNFLKGATYTSVLSIGALGGLSSIAFANNTGSKAKSDVISSTNISDINIMQQKMLHKETVTLFNKSDHEVMLDALHPVQIIRVNGSLQIKPNFIESSASSGMIMILPRQRIAFDIQTTGGHFSSAEIQDVSKLDGQQLHLTSEHFAFNKLIPVSNFDSAVV
ncbi:MAG: twin-arginine translocation signal domain-containing protein [Cocleimonas sp.]